MGQIFETCKINCWYVDKPSVMRWGYCLFLGISVWLLLGTVYFYSSSVPAGEMSFQLLWLGRFSFVFSLVVLVAICIWRKSIEELTNLFSRFITIGLIVLGGIEGLLGLSQIYGYSVSHHSLYALTGSFYNPGPYSGYLAMVFPLCLYEWLVGRKSPVMSARHWIAWIALGVGVLILCVLPAGMSRSAWLASLFSSLWVCAVYFSWYEKVVTLKRKISRKSATVLLLGFVIVALGSYGLFHLKSASADGRLLMWKIGVETVLKHPLTGYGHKGFARGFGQTQEEHFAKGGHAAWEEAVAGSPEYAFNEYLQLAIEYGIPVLIGVLGVVVVALIRGYKKGRIGICGSILSVLVFSFSSYPMQIPGFAIAFFLLIAACLLHRKMSWIILWISFVVLGLFAHKENRYEAFQSWNYARMSYNMGIYSAAKSQYESLYPSLNDQGAFLFEYGHCLHKLGNYELSTLFLKEAMNYSTDPMILNIIGKNSQALGRYDEAEKWFVRSTHRLPGRIYPYYLLAKLYAHRSFYHPDKLKRMVQVVLTKEPKVQSTAIQQMRGEVKRLLR